MRGPGKWPSTVDRTEVRTSINSPWIPLIYCYVGLLVGACINRAPEGTFGAAVAEVGVMDLLKVHFCFRASHCDS